MIAYTKTKAPPKFCNPWGATSVCEQVHIREKRECNMTCYIHLTSKRKYDGQDLKVTTRNNTWPSKITSTIHK